MPKHPKTFDDILSLWGSPKELSVALDVPYVTAQQMKRRKTVSVEHWPKLIELTKARGIQITADDLLKMKVAA